MVGIYKITNPKGKVYIGQSKNIENRFKIHLRESNLQKKNKLYNSFKKYGAENHTFEIVEECALEDLNRLEEYYGTKYNVLEEGLNHRLGNGKWHLNTLTVDHRAKISEAMKGVKWSVETIEKRRKSMIGKNTQKVRCLNDGNIFSSIQEATDYYGLKWRKYIEDVCNHRAKHIKGLVFEKIEL
jgi:group I intron endonuclease